jgi:geranylgeranyl transferase type-2 subunit alpha
MHNRKKAEFVTRTDAEISALRKKCVTYSTLLDIVFARRASKDYSDETFQLVGKFLRLNPDFYSLWNYRREICNMRHSSASENSTVENSHLIETMRDGELALSADGIRKNPKSCKQTCICHNVFGCLIFIFFCGVIIIDGAWFHRYWVVTNFTVDTENELSLCNTLLSEDQRNFHCWNYRRFLVHHKINQSPVENTLSCVAREVTYSECKIMENFSNYSAFHHRSSFIKSSTDNPKHIIASELGMIESAVFTEPDDQSAWWYHQFLLKWALSHSSVVNDNDDWVVNLLIEQLKCMQKLLFVESQSKWAMIAKISIIDILAAYRNSAAIGKYDVDLTELICDRNNTLLALIDVDPSHANRYRYLLRKLSC